MNEELKGEEENIGGVLKEDRLKQRDDENIAVPLIINDQPLEPMEVHHHPNVEKKNFKEYLLEGLMIFLAVTMGFFAENIREHLTENKKANELAESLYNEVYNDSVAMQQKIKIRLQKETEMRYLKDYFKDSSLDRLPQRAKIATVWTFILVNQSIFEPKDGILSQLKNTNSLRFFKNADLQNLVGDLYVSIARVRTRNEQEYIFFQSFIRPFALKHFDFRWFDAFTEQGNLSIVDAMFRKNYPDLPYQLNNLNEIKTNDAESLISYYLVMARTNRQVLYQDYVNVNHRLLESLRKNYQLRK